MEARLLFNLIDWFYEQPVESGAVFSLTRTNKPNVFEFAWLDQTDLVFIDPVGTGQSRMAEGERNAEYHDFQRDLDSIAEFIRLWLSRHGRWSSPIHLSARATAPRAPPA